MPVNKKLLKLALQKGDALLEPFGERDVLLFYGTVAGALEKFLAGKPLASKVWMPQGIPFLIKRGSLQQPLSCSDLARHVDAKFLKARVGRKLEEGRKIVSERQALIWEYFLPRKLCDFFYATNGEGEGKPIERIFIDMDRGRGVSKEAAAQATKLLMQEIREDSEFRQLAAAHLKSSEPFVYWTGSSFHFLFFLKQPQPPSFYLQHFQYQKGLSQKGFAAKWALLLSKHFQNTKIMAGHQKQPGTLSLDPSQTPSGKLCRAPLGGLHMSDFNTVNGVSLPVDLKKLESWNARELVEELSSYTPQRIVAELLQLQKLLPKI